MKGERMYLDVAELVGVELFHDERRVLIDAVEDLGELVRGGRQIQYLFELFFGDPAVCILVNPATSSAVTQR
jgi:hypothetical protein